MSFFSRLVRLCRADLHGVLDQMEDKPLMLRQCLRDMETAIEEARLDHRRLAAEQERVRREYERTKSEVDKLERDALLAVEKCRDDLARQLIQRKQPLARAREEWLSQAGRLDRDLDDLGRRLDQREAVLRELRARVEDYIRRAARPSVPASWDRTDGGREPSAEDVEFELMALKAGLSK
jgi:phage shock protein A